MNKQHEYQPFWTTVACYPGVIPYHPSTAASALSNKTFVTGYVPDKALFLTNVPHKFLSSKHFLDSDPVTKMARNSFTGNGRRLMAMKEVYVDDLPFVKTKKEWLRAREKNSILNSKWIKSFSFEKSFAMLTEINYGLTHSEFDIGYSTVYGLNQYLEERYNEAVMSNLTRSKNELTAFYPMARIDGRVMYLSKGLSPGTDAFHHAWIYALFSKYMTRTDGRPFPYYTVDRYREHMCHYKPYTYRDYINDYFADMEPSINGWVVVSL